MIPVGRALAGDLFGHRQQGSGQPIPGPLLVMLAAGLLPT